MRVLVGKYAFFNIHIEITSDIATNIRINENILQDFGADRKSNMAARAYNVF
jgi:hypothetical protein